MHFLNKQQIIKKQHVLQNSIQIVTTFRVLLSSKTLQTHLILFNKTYKIFNNCMLVHYNSIFN